MKSTRSHNFFVFLILCSWASPCAAQESLEESVRSLSNKQIVIPSEGITLSGTNFDAYKTIIPVELTNLLKQGILTINAKPLASAQSPTRENIDEQDSFTKILLSSQDLFEREHTFVADFTLSSVPRTDNSSWSVKGEWSRIYPTAIDAQNSGEQLMREKISLTNPTDVAKYTWLTFQFIGLNEDLVWVYSPAIKKDRQILSSLRTDPLFHSALSAEDIMTWSGKLEAADGRVLGRSQFVLPTIQRISAPILSSDGCSSQSQEPPSSSDSFSPYNAWRIELINKDPYSLYGKQILYIHANSNLPLMKAVYNRKGQLYKIIYSSFAVSPRSAPENGVAYWLRNTTAYDLNEQSSATFSLTHTTYCPNYTESVQLKHFDPTQLGIDLNPVGNKN